MATSARDAHAALSRTLATGRPIAADATGVLTRLAVMEPSHVAAADAPPGNALAFARLRPAAGALDLHAVPPWAHGMKVTQTSGPFVDEHNIGTWIDTIVPAPSVTLVRGANGPALGYLQSASIHETSAGGTTTVTLGAGSIWFVARTLAAAAPANGFAGIAFTGATLKIPGGLLPSPQPDVFVIGAGVTATLHVVPEPSAAAGTGLVNDGTNALASLPASITFALAPDGAHVIALDDATLAAYGSTALLAGGAAGASFDADLLEIAVAFAAVTAPKTFAIAGSVSAAFAAGGAAEVLGGSYRIPVALTTPAALGPAASGGALALALGAGISARWGNLAVDVGFASALVHVQTGTLIVTGRTAARPFTDTYACWDAPGPQPRATSLALSGARGALVISLQSNALDAAIAAGCDVAANFDRPRVADGTTARFDTLVAEYGNIVTAQGRGLIVLGARRPLPFAPVETFVIENALLRSAGIDAMFVSAVIAGGRAAQGIVLASAMLERIVPTLPHPYAASLSEARDGAEETLVAVTSWAAPRTPALAFVIARSQQAPAAAAAPRAGLFAGRFGPLNALLDVSSFANQFGVMIADAGVSSAQIVGQTLAVSGEQSLLFTVPDVAWEPVIDADRNFVFPLPPNDGEGALLAVPSVTLRPATPRGLIDAFLAEYPKGADMFGLITLPFGLTGALDTSAAAGGSPQTLRPHLREAMPHFPAAGLDGGEQLSVIGVTDAAHPLALMPGSSFAAGGYPTAMLGNDIALIWNEEFDAAAPPGGPGPGTKSLPLQRFDLSGYGISTFSSFVDPNQDDPDIAQARFDVIVGRTSFELVQAQSVIAPHRIPVVNTTIFSRDDTGYVQRVQTGWQAKGPGLIDWLEFGTDAVRDPNSVEKRGITGFFNVRNIVETGETVSVDGKTWTAVRFDADVRLNAVAAGLQIAGGATDLPGTAFTGWLDLTANPLHTPALRPGWQDAYDLLDEHGPASGTLAADADIAGTGIGVTITGIEIKASRGDAPVPALVVAFRTTPHLPRDGSWSVGTRTSAQAAPQAVDARTSVPLIFPNAGNAWHFADAGDVHALTAPNVLYGILQGTGTQKTFYEQPIVAPAAGAAKPLTFAQQPKLADVGALLGDAGLLPNVDSLLPFTTFTGFAPAGDGFGGQTFEGDVTLNRTLVSLGAVTVVMSSPDGQQSHITATVDAAAPAGTPRWSVKIANVAFKLAVDGAGGIGSPLVTVSGDVAAQDGGSPTLSPLTIDYGSFLSVVKDILDGIQTFMAFLPDAGKSGIDVSFAGSALRIREAFPIPKLPLGLGYIENIALDLGFDLDIVHRSLHFFVGVGTDRAPFHWLVSPLSGNGFLQLGATDQLGVKMQAGIGVGLAIDLAILSGSASIVLAVQLDTTKTPFGVMVLLTGNAAVDVLDGLASASLTLTAGVGIAVSPPSMTPIEIAADPIAYLKGTIVTLSAEVAVGVHISVCWVVHVDFDGSWPFSETISGAALTSLLP